MQSFQVKKEDATPLFSRLSIVLVAGFIGTLAFSRENVKELSTPPKYAPRIDISLASPNLFPVLLEKVNRPNVAEASTFADRPLIDDAIHIGTVFQEPSNREGLDLVSIRISSTTIPPAAPSGLSAVALSSSSIKINWLDNSNNETGFAIIRWNGSAWVQIASVGANVTSFTDTGLQPSTTYFHAACSQNSAGTFCSAMDTVTTTQAAGIAAPEAPTGLSAVALSSSSIKINWLDNSNNETGFVINRWNGSAWVQIASVGANVTSFTDTGLQPSTTYFHAACSQNSAGTTCSNTFSTVMTQASTVVGCGDERDQIIAEYATFGINLSPTCNSFTQSAHSVFFTFAELNVNNPYTWAIIRSPLTAPSSVGYGLDKWRQSYGSARNTTSVYRAPAHNKAVNGVSDSRHMFGDAVDLLNQSQHQSEWDAMVTAAGLTGAKADYIEPLSISGLPHVHADWRNH